MGAKAVVIAVIDTDNSTLPFESEDMKFEIFPPGHDATSNIPIATIGVINGFSKIATRNVTAGSATHCNNTPKITDLGLCRRSLNVCSLIPKATPNITNAKMIFTNNISFAPRLMLRASK